MEHDDVGPSDSSTILDLDTVAGNVGISTVAGALDALHAVAAIARQELRRAGINPDDPHAISRLLKLGPVPQRASRLLPPPRSQARCREVRAHGRAFGCTSSTRDAAGRPRPSGEDDDLADPTRGGGAR